MKQILNELRKQTLILEEIRDSLKKGKKNNKKEIISIKNSPLLINKDFFNSSEKQSDLILFLEKKKNIKYEVAREIIMSFINYWTEKNKSGTKQRWELEKTFELKRRLCTWIINYEKWGSIDKVKNSQNNTSKVIKF